VGGPARLGQGRDLAARKETTSECWHFGAEALLCDPRGDSPERPTAPGVRCSAQRKPSGDEARTQQTHHADWPPTEGLRYKFNVGRFAGGAASVRPKPCECSKCQVADGGWARRSARGTARWGSFASTAYPTRTRFEFERGKVRAEGSGGRVASG
jgi:hypothetical protein